MLELQILGFNVLLPVVLMIGGWLVVHRLRRSASAVAAGATTAESNGVTPARSAALVVASCGCLAIVAAMLFRVEATRAVFPEDAWARIPHALLLVSAGAVVGLYVPGVWGWLARGVALFFAARWIIPRGEAWEFLEPQIPIWLSMIIGSSLLAWYLSSRLNDRWPGVLSMSWIACVVAAAFLSQDFLKVTEPLLAVASVLGMAGLMSLVYRNPQFAAIVAGPSIFAMSACVASAQFNSFLGLPDSLSWLAIASPSLAGLSTLAIRGPANHSLTKRKLALVIVACIIMAALVITWTVMAGGVGGEEEW